MRAEVAVFQSTIPLPREFVWSRYTRPGMFQRLSPPWQNIKVLSADGGVRPGDRVILRPRIGPLPLIWEAIHGEYVEGELFSDRQGLGPFATWEHRHHFLDAPDGGCTVRDEVTVALPLAALSHPLGMPLAARELRRMFYYRHFVAFQDMLEHYALRETPHRGVIVRGKPEEARAQIAAYLGVAGHDIIDAGGDQEADTVSVAIEPREDGRLGIDVQDGKPGGSWTTITTGLLLERSVPMQARIAVWRVRDPDRRLEWTTVSDVAAAVHRVISGQLDGSRYHVAHRTPTSPRELATLLISGGHRDPDLHEQAGGHPASSVDGERVVTSRYRDAGHALGVMAGRP